MAAGQQQAVAFRAAEVPGAEHGEDAAPLIVVDEPAGQPQVLNAVPAGAPERNQRVERQPGHRPGPGRGGEHLGQACPPLRRQEDGQVGVGHYGRQLRRQRGQHGRQLVDHVTGDDRGRMLPGHLDGVGQPGASRCFRRRARGQPGPCGRVSEIHRAGLDPGAAGQRRQLRRRRTARPSDLAAQAQAGGGRTRSRSAGLVVVAVQLQAQAGARAEVDQRDLTAGRPGDGSDAERDLGTAGDLVHLVTARPAQAADLSQPGRHKRAGGGLEAVVKQRLGLIRARKIPGHRLGLVTVDQKAHRGGREQAGQPACGQRRQRRQQFLVAGNQPEQGRGQLPRFRAAWSRPAGRDLQCLVSYLRYRCHPLTAPRRRTAPARTGHPRQPAVRQISRR